MKPDGEELAIEKFIINYSRPECWNNTVSFGKQKSNFSCSLRILFFSRKNTDNFLVKAISSPEGVCDRSEIFFFNTSEQSLAIHDAFKCVGYAGYKGSSMYRDCQVSGELGVQ